MAIIIVCSRLLTTWEEIMTRCFTFVVLALFVVLLSALPGSAHLIGDTVPFTGTSALTGTLSGCSGSVASVWMKPTRSSRVSPIPTIPPEQTLMPDLRT